MGRHAALCDVYGTGAQLLPHHRAMQLMSSFMQLSATDDKRVLLQEERQSEEWSCSTSKEDITDDVLLSARISDQLWEGMVRVDVPGLGKGVACTKFFEGGSVV